MDPEAHEAYLKGRFHAEQASAEDLQKSVEFLESAIEKDPAMARRMRVLARVSAAQPLYFLASGEEGASKAKALAEQALALDDTLDEAHVAIARALALYDHDWEEAENSFRRGLALNPNSALGPQLLRLVSHLDRTP